MKTSDERDNGMSLDKEARRAVFEGAPGESRTALSDDDMEKVVGGYEHLSPDIGYNSAAEVVFKFHVGQRVAWYDHGFTLGTVKTAYIYDHPLRWLYYPCYIVTMDNPNQPVWYVIDYERDLWECELRASDC